MKPHEALEAEKVEEIAASWPKKSNLMYWSEIPRIIMYIISHSLIWDFQLSPFWNHKQLSLAKAAVKEELLRTKGDVAAGQALYVT